MIDNVQHLILTNMETPNFLSQIDFTELRTQKTTLLAIIEYYKNNNVPFLPEQLTGILHLIDAIQDYACDEMGISEMHIFDFEEEEKRND